MIDEDKGRDLPKKQIERAELFEAYARKFKEQPPAFAIPPQELLQRIKTALRTGKKIRLDVPRGVQA